MVLLAVGTMFGVATTATGASAAPPVPDAPAAPAPDAPPATAPQLQLDPVEGEPGSTVAAVATGFVDCPLEGNDDVGDPEVVFTWIEQGVSVDLGTVVASGGVASTSFEVPTETSPDTHAVVARCTGDAKMTAEASFLVTPPPAQMTEVPDLLGLTLEDADARLDAAQLVRGAVSGTGDLVGEQSLPAGTEVTVGTAVDVTLQPLPPETVPVPDLVGMSTGEAAAALSAVGLRLAISGSSDGDVIDAQDPAPGTAVPVASEVTVHTTTAPSLSLSTAILVVAAVLLALAIIAAMAVLLRVQHVARQRAWVAAHVRATPVTPVDVRSAIDALPDERDARRHVVRIEAHSGDRRHEIEEVRS
ncbi:hypothetical protein GCM10010932_04240 [Agromyces flavus]|nr:hypothetical protein GCM10010932_04240 [Agromyces flavus]